ncbi:hypothetical protein Emed_002191 [Eimeria media]
MALAAGGWQLAERLELFPKPHKKVMPLPKFDFERLEAKQADAQLNLGRLRRAWEHTSEEVRVGFVKKLQTYVQPSEPGAAAAAEKQNFDDVLSSLRLPATALRSAPIPESDEAVADYVLQSELEAVASAGKEEAFTPFIAQFEKTEGPLPHLVIPAGGKFRTEAFINLVTHLCEARMKFTSFSSEAMMELAEDFTIESAVEVLDQAEDSASWREDLTKRLVKDAAKGTAGSEEKLAYGDKSIYRTLLGVFSTILNDRSHQCPQLVIAFSMW